MTDLLSLHDVRMEYRRPGWLRRSQRPVVALDRVSLAIRARSTFGLVGESGSGKSTIARIALGLVSPTGGRVLFDGEDMYARGAARRGGEIAAVFQDPSAALNPRKRVCDIVSLPLRLHTGLSAREVSARTRELLETVALSPADRFLDRFPHELSGGQRQRVVIARAIALRPRLIVADEPVSALDMSIRAQVLATLADLKASLDLTYLFITHNMDVARAICDDIGVLYLGRLAEVAPAAQLHSNPLHPYTRMLMDAVPKTRPTEARARQSLAVRGDVPAADELPAGCRFHPRCPHAFDACRHLEPPTVRVGASLVACHLYTPQPKPSGDRHDANPRLDPRAQAAA
ncbi:MAG TPA: ABC transporter ATP-binding protein [Ramlibacter sp.]|uniref:ABC transporter ATP-binding protein n=1 Tax=Ramlibacter sp. TaxID=1917967 RepID=UPI002B59AAB5|nr:ABC transporter ATP-binding protein [Ramlibacter sp.]HVZ43855.1 ABC transporter ATP-binding protein [Ramlibacter sp.]